MKNDLFYDPAFDIDNIFYDPDLDIRNIYETEPIPFDPMPEERFPERFICEGVVPGITKYCVDKGRIYEGFMPGGKCVACIGSDKRIYEGYFPWGKCIANIGDDNRIYEGYFPGKVIGSIIDGRITLDGNYFPTHAADFNIF